MALTLLVDGVQSLYALRTLKIVANILILGGGFGGVVGLCPKIPKYDRFSLRPLRISAYSALKWAINRRDRGDTQRAAEKTGSPSSLFVQSRVVAAESLAKQVGEKHQLSGVGPNELTKDIGWTGMPSKRPNTVKESGLYPS